jgi:hypothetical protein
LRREAPGQHAHRFRTTKPYKRDLAD